MEANKNQYGLIIPKKTPLGAPVLKKPAVFDSESDEESNSVNWMSEAAKKEKYGSGKSRQVKADMERVLKDDPTVYQYDEVYDDMKKKKDDAEAVKKNDKKPRYMGLLIKQAERRKREDERRKERQIQKEREAEGDQFADKEVFVTSAYKKQLEEHRKMDEEDKRMERLEDIGDVTKQCDLNGFYRHLYETMHTKEPDPTPEVTDSAKFREVDKKKARNIRKRVMSDEENNSGSDKEGTSDKKRKSSDVEDSKPKLDVSRVERIAPAVESKAPIQTEEIKNEPRDDSDKGENEDKNDDKKVLPTESAPVEETIDIEELKKKMIPKRKTDIWVKRTVGEVFEAALQRYRERKESMITAY